LGIMTVVITSENRGGGTQGYDLGYQKAQEMTNTKGSRETTWVSH